jgi:uncharacterized protein YbjT (DUF2867 family)
MAQQEKRNVLVTGASGGVGVPLVGRLEELGYRVFAGVRRGKTGARSPAGDATSCP